MSETSETTSESSAADSGLFTLLVESYGRVAREALAPAGRGPEWLYEQAPFALLAHDARPQPRFIYANRAAQRCFEYSWSEIVGLPSHLSAAPSDRAERLRLLETVRRDGIVRGYRGLRIAKSGRRFWIDGGTVWQITDSAGRMHGQAALFTHWSEA